jgi:hypothetical protein
MSAPEPDRSPSSFSAGRRWLIGVNVFLKIAAFLAVVVMINYLAAGHFRRWQWAGGSLYKLSPATRSVLGGLTNDVTITIFFEPHGDNEQIYGLTAALLKEYQSDCPRHVHVRTLDYSREDSEARDFLNKHQLSGLKEKDFVFVEDNGQTETIYAKNLADYDFSNLLSGRSKYVRRKSFLGESYFTGAIYSVGYCEPTKAYFLSGHGERDPGAPGDAPQSDGPGISQLAEVLKTELNCDWAKVSLTGTNDIPDDCQLLIIGGPSVAELGAGEIDKINSYLSKGGRLLALAKSPLDPPRDFQSGLEGILKGFNLGLGDGFVIDTDKRYQIGQFEFLTAAMASHPITDGLIAQDSAIRMSAPRPIYILNTLTAPGAPQIVPLASTTSKGHYGTQIGSFILIAAVEQGVIPGVNAARGGTRLVVAGDVDFLDDRNINTSGNHYFASLALKWLLYRSQLAVAGVPPRPIKEYRLYLTQSQSKTVHWLFLAGMPGGVMFLGGLVWLRRRS